FLRSRLFRLFSSRSLSGFLCRSFGRRCFRRRFFGGGFTFGGFCLGFFLLLFRRFGRLCFLFRIAEFQIGEFAERCHSAFCFGSIASRIDDRFIVFADSSE